MLIVWDEPKRKANLAKHGMDFADLDAEFLQAVGQFAQFFDPGDCGFVDFHDDVERGRGFADALQ